MYCTVYLNNGCREIFSEESFDLTFCAVALPLLTVVGRG